MQTLLPYITESQQILLQETISKIAKIVMPEKIICYGVRVQSSKLWSNFEQESEDNIITLDLLIILHEKNKGKRESVSDIVENLSNDSIKLIAVVHSMDAVNTNLEAGNPFFGTLYRSGILVYDNNDVPLSIPLNEAFNGSHQTAFNQYNQRKLDLARMFHETACDCVTDGRNDVAVFMLHQAVELASIALLRTCLGYRPTTHNIRKLFLLIENITPDVRQLFPGTTTQEKEIFNTLQKAYSEVRYKDGYTVSADMVFILLERVSELVTIVSTLCQDKWNQIIKYEEHEQGN
jgi:HEPN domain-containing protein